MEINLLTSFENNLKSNLFGSDNGKPIRTSMPPRTALIVSPQQNEMDTNDNNDFENDISSRRVRKIIRDLLSFI